MKKHNILKVVLLSILVVLLCTWIFPSASYQYELVVDERAQLGIFDLFAYVVELFRYFPYVILMVLATGIFYGVAYRIPAYRVMLDKIVKKFAGKEPILLAAMMILIAAIVSVSGLSFGILFIFPFVISIVLLMGYNKLVAASVTVGSTIVGILGTTLGSSTTYYINVILGTEVQSEMITKVILLVISLVLLIYNVLLYAKKTKNNTDKVLEFVPVSASSERKDAKVTVAEEKKADSTVKEKKDVKKATSKKNETAEKQGTTKNTAKTGAKASSKTTTKKGQKTSSKTTAKKASTKTRAYDLKSKVETKVTVKPKKKVHIWPFVLVFDLVIIILAIASFDWVGVFNIDIFEQALEAVREFEIGGFPIFAKLLGNVNVFGEWSLNYEMPTLIILATCFLGFIYGLKFDEFLDGVVAGVKKAIRPAIFMFLVYLVLVIVTYNPFQLNITKFFLDITNDFNVITMTIVSMISSIFNVENVYVAQSTLPYVTSVITDSTLYPLLGVIFQSIYGLMMLVAPTSVILIGVLSYLDVSYGQWLKHIWKLFLQLLIVLVVIFFIVFLI